MRLAFAGTPEFARIALQALLDEDFEVALVLTQPDRPAGRGLQLQPSPVKTLALERGIALAQPRGLRLDGKYPEDARAARAALEAVRPDALVVAAYGLILPQWVLDDLNATDEAVEREGRTEPPPGRPKAVSAPSGGSATGEAVERGGRTEPPPGRPKAASAPSGGSATGEAVERGGRQSLGCINIHASLLPRWRGAAPIQRAIEAGDASTGVTIMQMDTGLDTGDMLLQEALTIAPRETAASLHDRLARLGARLIVRALRQAEAGRLARTPQAAEGVSYAHKIDKREAVIDWAQPAERIERRVRAFEPFPGMHTTFAGKAIKIWDAELAHDASTACRPTGEILAVGEAGIVVACGTGALRLTGLQRAGGKRLRAREFLAGQALAPGQRLGAVPEDAP